MSLLFRFLKEAKNEGLVSALRRTKTFLRSWFYELVRPLKLWFLRKQTNTGTIIQDINGSKMELEIRPESSHDLDKELAANGIREPGSTHKFQEILDRIKRETDRPIHVFDVGANVGYFALLEANILGERGHIYAIEAAPDNAERLERNISLNEYTQIKVLQIALGESRTTKELCIKDKSNQHHISDVKNEGAESETVNVEMYPLDEIIAENPIQKQDPVIIRMDIEGYEGFTFEGATRFLASDRPAYIFVELHPREYNPHKKVVNALKNNGFEVEYISTDHGQTVQPADSFDPIPEDRYIHLMASRNL